MTKWKFLLSGPYWVVVIWQEGAQAVPKPDFPNWKLVATFVNDRQLPAPVATIIKCVSLCLPCQIQRQFSQSNLNCQRIGFDRIKIHGRKFRHFRKQFENTELKP